MDSEVALLELRWPHWDQRRAAGSARFAAKVAELQQPIALASCISRSGPAAHGISTRAMSTAEYVEGDEKNPFL